MILYKDGKKCNCDPDQLAQMREAGWSETDKKSNKKSAPKAPN